MTPNVADATKNKIVLVSGDGRRSRTSSRCHLPLFAWADGVDCVLGGDPRGAALTPSPPQTAR